MKIKVTGRHTGVSSQMKDYGLEKAERLDRFFDRIQSADIVLNVEGERHVAEIRVSVPGDTLFGKEESEDMYSSIDLLIDNIGRQLRRFKSKLNERRGPVFETDAGPVEVDEEDESFEQAVEKL